VVSDTNRRLTPLTSKIEGDFKHMAKRVQDMKPPRSDEATSWIRKNDTEQKKRYRAIAKEMDDLAPKRVKWYKKFLKDVSTTGFNMTGDIKRVIKKSELPVQPKRKDKVVW
jgi:hypothetical protein